MIEPEEEFEDATEVWAQGEEIPMGTVRRGTANPKCKRCSKCRLVEPDPERGAEYQQLYSCQNSRSRVRTSDGGSDYSPVLR